jgi:hypothetical protein
VTHFLLPVLDRFAAGQEFRCPLHLGEAILGGGPSDPKFPPAAVAKSPRYRRRGHGLPPGSHRRGWQRQETGDPFRSLNWNTCTG